MSKLQEIVFIKKAIGYREYALAVMYLVMLNKKKVDIAWKIVKIFEGQALLYAFLLE